MIGAASSSLAAATPWGAGLQALSSIGSTPTSSATGAVTTGARTIGGVSFAPSATQQTTSLVLVAGVVVALVLLLGRRK